MDKQNLLIRKPAFAEALSSFEKADNKIFVLKNFCVRELVANRVLLSVLANRRLVDFMLMTIKSEYKKIEQVKNKVADFLIDYCQQIDLLLIGLQEIAANAIEHGNKEDSELEVEFAILVLETGLVVEVKDEGIGFEWKTELEKDICLADCSESGRGLAIANKVFDLVSYNQSGNRAILYKNI